MGHTIVLAHGVLGFGNPFGINESVGYFNGVETYLTRLGHDVVAPQVASVGSIEARGKKLADGVRQAAHDFKRPVHIIAHSMGGLDARYAITKEFKGTKTVATLITISTPHLGSPVADALMREAGPIFDLIPGWIRSMLHKGVPALRELTTEFVKDFDATTEDIPEVRYIQVAGDAKRAVGGIHLLFRLAAQIGRLENEVNDGVVTKTSALRPSEARPAGAAHQENHENLVEDWPADHAGEVGWSRSSPLPILFPLELPISILDPTEPLVPTDATMKHLHRYRSLVAMLR
jgi:triacylglycerol lipase